MVSARKIGANRINARASSGPKTVQEKARSSKNALRHGLSLPVTADPRLSNEIAAMAHKLAGDDSCLMPFARAVAEAQIDLVRIQTAWHNLLAQLLRNPPDESEPIEDNKKIEQVNTGAELSELPSKLLKVARYERRAISRRKHAIREYEIAASQARKLGER